MKSIDTDPFDFQGGKFGHGFLSAGLTKAIGINKIFPGRGLPKDILRIIAASVLGGTISEISGGKFANGAVTAAFGQAVNGNSECANDPDCGGTNNTQNLSKNVQEAFDYISNSKSGKELITDFNATGASIVEGIDPKLGLSNTFNEETNTIYWDPSVAMDLKAGISSPALVLAHEMSHAIKYFLDPAQFLKDLDSPVSEDSSGNFVYSSPPEEIRAVIHINVIRSELGEPLRIGYRDHNTTFSRGITWSCRRDKGGC